MDIFSSIQLFKLYAEDELSKGSWHMHLHVYVPGTAQRDFQLQFIKSCYKAGDIKSLSNMFNEITIN